MTIVIIIIIILGIVIIFNWSKWSKKATADAVLLIINWNKVDKMEMALDKKMIKINQKIEEWRTPLIMASMMWKPDIVELLLKKWAEVDIKDNNWWTALCYWCASFSLRNTRSWRAHWLWFPRDVSERIVKLLVEHWANPYIKNNNWYTALQYLEWAWESGLISFINKYHDNIWNIRKKYGILE